LVLLPNGVLSTLKIFAGIVGHSGAMIADGVHSISDFLTDIIVLVFIGVTARGGE
jgi:divalent metal cation (Fe/Co/Zn/Cd) transporter